MPAALNFKEIAETIDIEEVARHVGITFVKNRAPCPICQSSDRGLELFPETNTFCCYSAPAPAGKRHLGGDCITFYGHVKGLTGQYKAAKELAELFGIASANRTTVPATAPQARPEEAPKAVAKPERSFDPAAFAAKLTYGTEVQALGLTEDEAKAECIGLYKGQLYIPRRYASGAIPGFWKVEKGKLIAPKTWLPDTSNVVTLRRA